MSDDRIDDGQFSSQSEVMREFIRPYNEKESHGVVNKDLKLANITQDQQRLVIEMTDVALQCARLGCEDFAWHLIQVRDTMLASSSSIDGFERKMATTTTNIHKIPEEMKTKMRIFGTKDQKPERAPSP